MKIVIDITEEIMEYVKNNGCLSVNYDDEVAKAIINGTPLPEVHGRLGDLDELEQRISNFVERDASITDEYTVIRQRFIVDGIRQTRTIIEADKEAENE